MNLPVTHWRELSALLDEAFDLAPAQRAVWLERQRAQHPGLAGALERLLDAHRAAETAEAFAHLPALPSVLPADLPPDASHAGPAAAPAPGARVGPYRLLREIGRGGMAEVWLAERADGAYERTLALKLPHASRMRGDLAERFAHECDILARLEHPQIARLYDAGIDAGGLPYLAMEYVDGVPITQYCDARRLDVAARLRCFLLALEAVQYAHARLVVHRDLKPSNILVTAAGDLRLLDFGVAKLLADDARTRESQLTKQAGRALTPEYASPEQIRGEPLTTASDVYSAGVVLYELLTGRRPYRLKLDSAAQLEQAIVGAEPVRPSTLRDEAAARLRATTARGLARALAGDLDTILLKALAKEPAQRYPGIGAFAADLQRHLAGEAVEARPASSAYRARKFVRRHRAAVAAAGAIATALIGATAVSLYEARLARLQAQRADEVKRLVLSMYQDADTYSTSGGSRRTTAVELLAQARDRVAAAGVSDPAIQVELLTSIGVSLTGLGESALAAQVLGEAHTLAAARLGPSHRRTLEAGLHLGGALVLQGELARAGALIDAAEAGMRRADDRLGLVTALRWKSYLRAIERRFDESIALAAEAVRRAEAAPSPLAPRDLMDAYLTLAGAMGTVHRPGRLAPARRAYELAREVYGDRTTVGLLHARSLYAYALVVEGDTGAGIDELKALVQQQRRLLGPGHVEVMESYARIGLAALTRGDTGAAIEAFRTALQVELDRSDGAATRGVGLQHYRLGNALTAARHDEAAATELRAACRVLAAVLPADHAEVQLAQAALGLALARTGRLGEADAAFERARLRPLGDTLDGASIDLRLGVVRSAQGRHAEALALLERASDYLGRQAIPAAHARALTALGEAQLAAGRAAAAVATLQQARQRLEPLQPDRSPEHADLLVALARAQLALGQIDAAVVAAGEAAAFWARVDHARPAAGRAALWHARSLIAAGRSDEALTQLQRAAAVLATSGLPADRALLAQTRRELAAGQVARR